MIAPRRAWEIILARMKPVTPIQQDLADVAGLVLAEDVRADRDLPPADRSAMDGFAVRSADLESPAPLRTIGEVPAGSPLRPRIRAGTCVRILTGANLPPGADTVVMLEDVRERAGTIRILRAPRIGANILKRGEDAARGEILVRRGTPLAHMEIGVCAAVGRDRLRAYPRPEVAILCTGAELRSVSDRIRIHELRNSNGPALRAALELAGFKVARSATTPDQAGSLRRQLKRCLKAAPVTLITGGMSVGKYDLVRAALEAAGAIIHVHGVAMKPGKPFLYASVGRNGHVFGLPGNPLSAMTGFHEFVLPALRRLAGHDADTCRPILHLPLAAEVQSKGDRTRFELARIENDPSGARLYPIASRSSADLASAAYAHGVIVIPAGTRTIPAGQPVEFHPWKALT
jgi:molybdopterin molybdotransferase